MNNFGFRDDYVRRKRLARESHSTNPITRAFWTEYIGRFVVTSIAECTSKANVIREYHKQIFYAFSKDFSRVTRALPVVHGRPKIFQRAPLLHISYLRRVVYDDVVLVEYVW